MTIVKMAPISSSKVGYFVIYGILLKSKQELCAFDYYALPLKSQTKSKEATIL